MREGSNVAPMELAARLPRLRLLILAALASGVMVLVAPGPAQAVSTGSIGGTVTDAESGEPVEGVRVCAWGEETAFEEGENCNATDAAGEYAIALPPDTYLVEFFPKGLNYVPQYYDGQANWREATLVQVGSSAVTGIDAALEPGMEFSGTVTDALSGEPLEEIEVCAIDQAKEAYVACAETAADGTYTVRNLAAGSYYVEFWPWLNFNYMSQYWNGIPYLSEAELLEGAVGSSTGGIDAALEKGGAFSGTVTARATGGPLRHILVCARRASSGEYERCAYTASDGSYALPGLPPDPVKAEFSAEREGFEPDGFETQYWEDRPTLAEADSFAVTPGFSMLGVDAALDRNGGPPQPRPPLATPPGPVVSPIAITLPGFPNKPIRHRCRRGFRLKRVHGKRRCVRVKKHHHRHRRHHRHGHHG